MTHSGSHLIIIICNNLTSSSTSGKRVSCLIQLLCEISSGLSVCPFSYSLGCLKSLNGFSLAVSGLCSCSLPPCLTTMRILSKWIQPWWSSLAFTWLSKWFCPFKLHLPTLLFYSPFGCLTHLSPFELSSALFKWWTLPSSYCVLVYILLLLHCSLLLFHYSRYCQSFSYVSFTQAYVFDAFWSLQPNYIANLLNKHHLLKTCTYFCLSIGFWRPITTIVRSRNVWNKFL